MAWSWSVLLLVAVVTGVHAQVQLVQSGAEVKKPGASVKISCKASGYTFTSYGMQWVRQAPGERLEYIGWINTYTGKPTYAQGFSERVVFSLDTGASTAFLQINGLRSEDTATYFCAKSSGTNYFEYWGQGTLVTVSSDTLSAPNLYPLLTCENGLLDDKLVAMGCLARDFVPSSIAFSWTYKNSSAVSPSAVTSFPSVRDKTKYLATSHLFLPSADILKGLDEYVRCSVKHSGGNKDLDISLTVPEDQPPNVTVFMPPRDAFSSNSERTSRLLCQATGFRPRQIAVSWLKDGKRVTSGVTTDKVEPEPQGSGAPTYRVTSSLVVTESQWLSMSVFTCHVEHGNESFKKNVSSMCGTVTSAGLRIFATPPSFASIFLTKTATLSCLVTNLATYDSLAIAWTRQNGELLETHVNISESYPNATFSARGEASVCVEDWESGEEFTCTVTHTDLPSPVKQTVFKAKEATRHMPSVYVLPPTREQLSLQELASVTCLVKGFSPADVFVRWMQRGQPMAPSAYVTSGPMPEPQTPDLYFVYSILTVNTDDWLSGETYTCVVGHEALPHSVTERTVDKSTEGELGAEEEGFENLNAMASTFIVLFLLSLFYSTTVTLFKVK